MPKQKTIPELKAEIADNERQLTQLRHKQQQLENRAVYYEKGDRRKRAHRLITRGAAVESVAPLAKVLSETEFYAFAERVFHGGEHRPCKAFFVGQFREPGHGGGFCRSFPQQGGWRHFKSPFSCHVSHPAYPAKRKMGQQAAAGISAG